jgi:2,5-diketo-D-gluconate reductase B
MNRFFRSSKGRIFGTYPLKGEALSNAVELAITAGYRAFDTAQMYGNEADLGATLAGSGLPREELFVVTKVHPDNYSADRFFGSVEKSLRDLQLDRIDLLLLHWPPIGGDIAPPLRLLSEARQRGFTSDIGVSNFTSAMMHQGVKIVDAPIVTNQVEFHPLLDQSTLLSAAIATGIPLCSYSAIARGEVFKHKLFDELAITYGKTAAQIVLRWIFQKGVIVNAMSTKPDNINANWNIADFTLSSVDMARIDVLTSTNFRVVHKGLVPWAPDWD